MLQQGIRQIFPSFWPYLLTLSKLTDPKSGWMMRLDNEQLGKGHTGKLDNVTGGDKANLSFFLTLFTSL